MSDFDKLIDKFKKENKDMLVDELFNRGNVLADEQKFIRSEQKSMANILTNLEKLKGKITTDEYLVLLNEYSQVCKFLQDREEAYYKLYLQKREEDENRPFFICVVIGRH